MDKICKVTSTTPWDAKFVRVTGRHGANNDIVTVEYYRSELVSSRLENIAPAAGIMTEAKYLEMTKIDKPVSAPKANKPNKDKTLETARDKKRTDLPKGRNIPNPEKAAIKIWTDAAKTADQFPYLTLFSKRQNPNLPKRAVVHTGHVTGSQKQLKKKVTESIAPSANNVWTAKTVIMSSPTLAQDQAKQKLFFAKIEENGYSAQALSKDHIRELCYACQMSNDEIVELEAKIFQSPAPRLKNEYALEEAMAEAGIDNLDPEEAQASSEPVMNAELDDTAQVPEPKTGQSLSQVAANLKQLTPQAKKQFAELEVNQPLKVLYAGPTGQIQVKTLKIQSIIPAMPDGFEIVAKDAMGQEVKFSASLANIRQHAVTQGYYCIKKSEE